MNKYVVVLFGNGVTSLIGIAMTYVIFHNFSLENAGLWFFLQANVALCESGRYGLLSTATIKFYAGTSKERGMEVLGSVWFLALAFSVLLLFINGLAFLYLPYTHSYEVALCIKWIGINYLSSTASDVVFWRLQADQQYAKMFWFRMINACSTLGSFIILALVHSFTLEHVIIWNLLTNWSSSLIGIIWFNSGIQYIAHRSRDCIRELFHFGKFTLGTTLFSSFLGYVDIGILNFVLGPASIAIYNLSQRLMAFVDLPLRAFATTGISEMAVAYNTKDEHRVGYIFKKYAGMLTVMFVPIAIAAFIFAGVIMRILGGHNFDGASGALAANAYRMIMILAIIYPIDRFNGVALDVTNNSKVNFYKMVLVTCVKIVFGFLVTELLKSLYGIVIANYIATIVAVIYGHYRLRNHVPHTLPDVISTGFKELMILMKSLLYPKKNTI